MQKYDPNQYRPKARVPSVEAVLRLLKLDWFSRVWIIQEVVHNIDIVLFYGIGEMTWQRLRMSLFKVQLEFWSGVSGPSNKDALNQIEGKLAALKKVYSLWMEHCDMDTFPSDPVGNAPAEPPPLDWRLNDTIDRNSRGITSLITQFFTHGCSDDRDRIFAMYSMTYDICPERTVRYVHAKDPKLASGMIIFNVDYSQSVLETYRTFATKAILAGRITEILQCAATRRPVTKGWPSWVPNWTVPMNVPYQPGERAPHSWIPPTEGFFKVTGLHGQCIQLSTGDCPPGDPRTSAVRLLTVSRRGPRLDIPRSEVFSHSMTQFSQSTQKSFCHLHRYFGLILPDEERRRVMSGRRIFTANFGSHMTKNPLPTSPPLRLLYGSGPAELEEGDQMLICFSRYQNMYPGLVIRPGDNQKCRSIGDALIDAGVWEMHVTLEERFNWKGPIWLE